MQKIAPLVVTLLVLSACGASRDPYAPVASSQLHFCDNNEQMVLSLGDNSPQAALNYHGRVHNLTRIDSDADGEAFSDGIYTLYYDKERGGVLERHELPLLTGCFPAKKK